MKNYLKNDTEYNDRKDLSSMLSQTYGVARAKHMMKGEGIVKN